MLKGKLKLSPKVLITLGVAGVVLVGGIVAKTVLSKDDVTFNTEFYTATKQLTNVGTYKYTVSINKGADVKAVSNSDDSKSYKEVKDEASSDVGIVEEEFVDYDSDNFSDSWVTADGLRKSSSESDSEQLDFVVSGTNYSIKPLEAEGRVQLYSSNGTQAGLNLLGYYVKENIVYLDLSQTKQALLTSGNVDLIKLGNVFPDFTSIMKFEKDELVLDNINDTNQATELSSFNYVTFRKEVLRALSVLLNTASSGLDEAGCFSTEGSKYYCIGGNENATQVADVIKSLSDNTESMYQAYLEKLKVDEVVSSSQLEAKSKAVANISKTNKNILNLVLDFVKSEDFKTVNWVRNSSTDSATTSEVSLQASGVINDRPYLITVVGETSSKLEDDSGIKLPSSGISYRKAMKTDGSLVLSELVDKVNEVRSKSLDEIKESLGKEYADDAYEASSVDITSEVTN